MTTRIGAVISDIHFGVMDSEVLYNELKKRFLKPLKKIPKLDYIIIDGDLYDSKVSLDSSASKYAFRFIGEVIKIAKKKGAKVRLIEGTDSHDGSQIENFQFLEYDDSIDFRVIREVQEEELFPDYMVLYIPEEYMQDKEAFYEPFFSQKDKYKQIFGHGMLEFAAYAEHATHRPGAPTFTVAELNYCCVGPVIFGHVHTMQNYKYCYYCGSFSRWCQGEEKPKGFYLVMMNPDTDKFVVVPMLNDLARKYETIHIDKHVETLDVEEIVKVIDEYRIANDIYKLRVQTVYLPNNLNSAKLSVLKKYYQGNKHIVLDLKTEAIPLQVQEQEVVEKNEYLFDTNLSVEEKIQVYIKKELNYDMPVERVKELLSNNTNITELLNEIVDSD